MHRRVQWRDQDPLLGEMRPGFLERRSTSAGPNDHANCSQSGQHHHLLSALYRGLPGDRLGHQLPHRQHQVSQAKVRPFLSYHLSSLLSVWPEGLFPFLLLLSSVSSSCIYVNESRWKLPTTATTLFPPFLLWGPLLLRYTSPKMLGVNGSSSPLEDVMQTSFSSQSVLGSYAVVITFRMVEKKERREKIASSRLPFLFKDYCCCGHARLLSELAFFPSLSL